MRERGFPASDFHEEMLPQTLLVSCPLLTPPPHIGGMTYLVGLVQILHCVELNFQTVQAENGSICCIYWSSVDIVKFPPTRTSQGLNREKKGAYPSEFTHSPSPSIPTPWPPSVTE